MALFWYKFGMLWGIFAIGFFMGCLPLALNKTSPKTKKRMLSFGNSFAGGVFLTVGLTHLLGESSEIMREVFTTHIPAGLFVCLAGFLFVFFIEKVAFNTASRHERSNDTAPNAPQSGHTPHDSHSHDGHSHKKRRQRNLDTTPNEKTFLPSPHVMYATLPAPSSPSMDDPSPNHTPGELYRPLLSSTHESSPTSPAPPHADNHPHHHAHSDPNHPHHHDHSSPDDEPHTHFPAGKDVYLYILTFILSLHSFISGIALGVAGEMSGLLALFIAIVSHKWIEAFALGLSITKVDTPKMRMLKLIGFYSLTEPLGIACGQALSMVLSARPLEVTQAFVLAFTSGTFVYVAVMDILPQEFQGRKHKYIKFMLVLLGVGAMAALGILMSHDE